MVTFGETVEGLQSFSAIASFLCLSPYVHLCPQSVEAGSA